MANYSFVDEMPNPEDLELYRDGGWDAIGNAIAGVNFYGDSIGFGSPTGFAKIWSNRQFRDKQKPLGVRYFVKTGRTCSNGEPMYEYIDTIPKGNALEPRITNEARKMNLPPLNGLGIGIMEDAAAALNPAPLFAAINDPSEGKADCVKLRAPVGDADGNLSSKKTKVIWITDPVQKDAKGKPFQEYWIQKSGPEALVKNASKEGFTNAFETNRWIAGVLLIALTSAVLFSCKK